MDVSDDLYVSNSIKHDLANQSVLSHTDKDIRHPVIMDFRQTLLYILQHGEYGLGLTDSEQSLWPAGAQY